MADTDAQQEVSGAVKAPKSMLNMVILGLFGLLGGGLMGGLLGATAQPTPAVQPHPAASVTEAQVLATAKIEAAAAAKAEVATAEVRAAAIQAQQRTELLNALGTINGKLDTISDEVSEVRGRIGLPKLRVR
jgi:hypothetical protein